MEPLMDDLLLAAQIRLAKASDAWLEAEVAFDEAKDIYRIAFNEVMALRVTGGCEHPYVSLSWVGYPGYMHCHDCGKIVEDDER